MRNYVDRLLGLMSMYKGILAGLMVIWLVALIFSFFDVLSFSPLAMVASLGVLAIAVYGMSLLFGLMFGVRAHTESSFITALILALIFTPTIELKSLIILGLVGIIAAASKFMLTFRGRHIFNPVALAAFVIGLTGLGFASWWVATPPLFPFILAVVVVSLYQTRRFYVAGLFLLIATPLVVSVLVLEGASISEGLALLLSWPLLFFAGVMLTEPLTLARQKWQQTIEVVVVAILFAVPFTFGIFEMSPALALLVGNLIAFGFVRSGRITLKFNRKVSLTPSSEEIRFTTDRPVHFMPGQYVEITIPHRRPDLRGTRRSFSVTSIPDNSVVTLGVKYYEPSSTFKKNLRLLEKGTVVQATMFAGDFLLPKDPKRPLLFVAGGIGITPFISYLRYLASINQKRNITLVYAVSSAAEIAYAPILKSSGIKVLIVTKNTSTGIWPQGWEFLHESFVSKNVLEVVKDISQRDCFVSGSPAMVRSVKSSLRQLGVKHIKTDYFVGY
jgi:glycine betaine catabolism B